MSETDLNRLIMQFATARILILGDVMLDRYVFGAVERISYEAPIPILTVQREEAMLGGAGNVARNVAALKGQAILIGMIGQDAAGAEIQHAVAQEGIQARLIVSFARKTTVKTRYIAAGQQLLRSDYERVEAATAAEEDQLLAELEAALKDIDIVILSDYAKGVLTDRVIAQAIAAAKRAGKPVIVDPKGRDFNRYSGADFIKPNRGELAQAAAHQPQDEADLTALCRKVLADADIGAMLLTRAGEGMTLIEKGQAPLHLPAEAQEIFDVSGAGDTVIASFSLALVVGASSSAAARLASISAGLVVSKVGTAVVHREDLQLALNRLERVNAEVKLASLAQAQDQVARWHAEGLKVGFANGCFDLIHLGHISLIDQARAACDRLIVAINSDDSVRRLKGAGRPIQTEQTRARVLASFSAIDLVVVFTEDTPVATLEVLRPDLLVKGADYSERDVVGGDLVKSWGGKILLANLVPGHSTTATLAKLSVR